MIITVVIAVIAGVVVGASAIILIGALVAIISPIHRNPATRRAVDWIEKHSQP